MSQGGLRRQVDMGSEETGDQLGPPAMPVGIVVSEGRGAHEGYHTV